MDEMYEIQGVSSEMGSIEDEIAVLCGSSSISSEIKDETAI